MDSAVSEAVRALAEHDGTAECLRALEQAERLASEGDPSAERMEALGEGWVSEEALGMAVYCALGAVRAEPEGTQSDVRAGASAGRESLRRQRLDGAICGNVLGTLLGEEAIPQRWCEGVEMADVVLTVADDLHAADDGEAIPWDRYPGW